MTPGSGVDLTIVTWVRDADRHLDAFIASVEAQTLSPERFEVIVIDDGSTDGSRAILAAWRERRPDAVSVVTQARAGSSIARNRGIERAQGAWVTFADPRDRLAPDYLAEAGTFIAAHATLHCVAGRVMVVDEHSGVVSDSHPSRRNFGVGSQVRDLAREAQLVHGHAASTFFSLAELRRQQRRFHPALDGELADAEFCGRFVLGLGRPEIGFVSTASYLMTSRHRRSLLGPGGDRAGRHAVALSLGLRDLLIDGARASAAGRAPAWLQHLALFELSWLIGEDEAQTGAQIEMDPATLDDFHRAMAEVIDHLDDEVITSFSARGLKPAWRDFLRHGYAPEPWHQDAGLLTKRDPDQGLVRVAYRYTGDPPTERLFSGETSLEPMHAKVRDVPFFGRVLVRERIVWTLAREGLRLELNGREVELGGSARPTRLERGRRMSNPGGRARLSLRDRVVARLARMRWARGAWRDAWVLMDRITDAQDNGEHLFRFIRSTHPRIDAWFVLDRGSHDWGRLRREFGSRVVAHGSIRWNLLMANCRYLISSHADMPVIRPSGVLRLSKPKWRLAFLQHGVIHSDLSRWLNRKDFDLFVTSTPAEFASIAGDHSPYVFTTKEVKLTGLPRFDRLLEIGRATSSRRDLVLIAPTWRATLAPIAEPGTHRRRIDPGFRTSEFVRHWRSLIGSPELVAACRERELRLGFLPHPNLQPAVSEMDLPDHVDAYTFAEHDVQELFGRSVLLITDYSSMAFDVAYIERPIVYFQFDREAVLGGEHVGRVGYFDYERDGFGPVASTAREAVRLAVELLDVGRPPAPYDARIGATFPHRDGRCRERVFEELLRSMRRASPVDA